MGFGCLGSRPGPKRGFAGGLGVFVGLPGLVLRSFLHDGASFDGVQAGLGSLTG